MRTETVYRSDPNLPDGQTAIKTISSHGLNPQYVLDDGLGTVFYYPPRTVMKGFPTAVGGIMDTPTEELLFGFPCTRRTDEFHAILMFQPDTPDSILVPLSVLKWSWSFRARSTTVKEQHHVKDPLGNSSRDFPQWSSRFTKLETVGEVEYGSLSPCE